MYCINTDSCFVFHVHCAEHFAARDDRVYPVPYYTADMRAAGNQGQGGVDRYRKSHDHDGSSGHAAATACRSGLDSFAVAGE